MTEPTESPAQDAAEAHAEEDAAAHAGASGGPEDGSTTESSAAGDDAPAAPSDRVEGGASAHADDPTAPPPEFAELRPEPGAGEGQAPLAMLYDLMMPVSVELGRTAMTVRDVLGLGRGSVIPLNRLAGEPIDIYVSDRKLAEGEVVVLGDHFGVRLTRVIPSGSPMSAAEIQAQGI